MPHTIAFACGGTGGHVYPAIALAQHLPEQVSPIFLTSETREDSQIPPKYGYKSIILGDSSKSPIILFKLFLRARKVLRHSQCKQLIATGGQFTIPIILAAKTLGIPIYLLEQNTIPGKVNRLLAPLAEHVFISFEESLSFFKSANIDVTGNPIRSQFLTDEVSDAFLKLELPDLPIILVFGGSQGAFSLNDHFKSHHQEFEDLPFVLIHITGKKYYDLHFKKIPFTFIKNKDKQIKGVVMPYFEAMDELYKRASIVVSRSGATTCAELLHFQKKAILIPYPHATHNHQWHNAKALEKTGLATCLKQEDVHFKLIMGSIRHHLKSRDITKPPQINATKKILEKISL